MKSDKNNVITEKSNQKLRQIQNPAFKKTQSSTHHYVPIAIKSCTLLALSRLNPFRRCCCRRRRQCIILALLDNLGLTLLWDSSEPV